MDITFLGSNRFWAIFAVCVLSILRTYSIISPDIADPIIVLLLSFAGIRTIDRSFEKLSLPADK